ncbi:hypothetical protein KFK09_004239 [Dendrobium nobile]|uniref:SWIM-type domain-containing protein n=1 Tax=Dendrobium nobile TaxID=94219 RepID=A0A8T3C3I2_DENNO|nr:hypothetical protein KFK09_004239 [Dendrobium nobile]
MSSGSSEQCSDDEGADLLPVVNDGDAVDNEEIRNIVQDYCTRSVGSTDTMVANNDYAETCRTTEEWDKEVDIDADYDAVIVEDEFSIPNDLIEGMCFTRKTDLQIALQGWAIKNNVQYIVIASNRTKFTIVCAKHDCPVYPCLWRLHSAQSKRLGGVWKISSIKNQHRCVSPILDSGHRQCNSQFISFYILPTIRKKMDLKPREIIGRMESKFNIKVSYMKAWDARRKAIKVVFGSWEESYRTLNLFMDAVASVMPGTVYRIQSTQTNRFQRLFWAFGPSITGWKYCRPVLSLDGTFLLGKYRGTLLTAIGMDANNGLYPLAFAVVESECTESWIWFLRQVNELLPVVTNRPNLCIISDRHAGLVRGCREIFPNVAHRHCLRHLRENFKKAIRQMGIGDVDFLCQKMYAAGNTDDRSFFNRCMEDMRRIKVDIHQWLVDRDVSRWSLINDGGFRFGVMTTNAAESFNGVLKRARGLPIQALITAIYYNIISMFMRRLEFIATEEQQNNNFFAPRVQTLLKKVEEEARRMSEPIRLNLNEFQVVDMSSRSYRVDILDGRRCKCSCEKPMLYHSPCSHVVCCLALLRRSHFEYVSPYYTTTNYKLTYSGEFHHIPNKDEWGEHNPISGIMPLLPPNYRRRSGRPRTNRYRNTMDEAQAGSSRLCGACHLAGHNKATCPTRFNRRN